MATLVHAPNLSPMQDTVPEGLSSDHAMQQASCADGVPERACLGRKMRRLKLFRGSLKV